MSGQSRIMAILIFEFENTHAKSKTSSRPIRLKYPVDGPTAETRAVLRSFYVESRTEFRHRTTTAEKASLD